MLYLSRVPAPAPLEGLKVLDLSRVLAGPYATQRMADLGAQVIKVERPGLGDETRTWGPPWQEGSGFSSYFTSVNRGKKSVAIDFSFPEGLELVLDLAANADVVMHNFRPDSAAKLGLDHAALAKASPGVIICRISGFGDRREPAARPGYDLVVQAESGMMAITGNPDCDPHKVGVAIVDVLTGMEACSAILAALHRRDRTGIGADIDVPLLDTAFSGMANVSQSALATGVDPPRNGNAHASIVPYEPFPTADGQIVVAAANEGLWHHLCEAIEQPQLANDPRFATNPDRVKHRKELEDVLDEVFSKRSSDEWYEAISARGVPCGRVLGIRAGIAAAAASGDPVTLTLSDGTEVIGPPARIDGERLAATSPPTQLGADTDEILLAAGIAADRLAPMRDAGVIE